MKKIGLVVSLMCAVGVVCVSGASVFADNPKCGSKGEYNPAAGQVCCAPGTVKGGDTGAILNSGTLANCNVKDDDSLMPTINKVINVIVGMVGVVAVVMMIIGGITMTTSQGDTSKVTKGKNTLIFGIVGLIVAILAFAIVNFVLKSVFA